MARIRTRLSLFWHNVILGQCEFCGGRAVKEDDGIRHFYHEEGCPFMARLLRMKETKNGDA